MNKVRKFYSLTITDARPAITHETRNHQVGSWYTVLSILEQAKQDGQLLYTHVAIAKVLHDGTVIEHIWQGRGTDALIVLPATWQELLTRLSYDEDGCETYNIGAYASLDILVAEGGGAK